MHVFFSNEQAVTGNRHKCTTICMHYKIWRSVIFRNSPTLALQYESVSQILTSLILILHLYKPSQLN